MFFKHLVNRSAHHFHVLKKLHDIFISCLDISFRDILIEVLGSFELLIQFLDLILDGFKQVWEHTICFEGVVGIP